MQYMLFEVCSRCSMIDTLLFVKNAMFHNISSPDSWSMVVIVIPITPGKWILTMQSALQSIWS